MKLSTNDIKVLYLKYQVPITIFISTFFFVLSCFWSPFMIFSWVVLGITCIFSDIQAIIGYIVYFMMFSRNTVFFVGVAIVAFLSIIVKYIIDLVKKRVKTYKILLIATTVFCLAFCLHFPKLKFEGICQGLLFIGILYMMYLLFCYKDKISIKGCFNMLFYGIVCSAVVCSILYFIPSATVVFFDTNVFNHYPVKSLIFAHEDNYSRLMLLSYHPNHLASYCIYIISYNVYYFMNNDYKTDVKEFWKQFSMCLISIIIGFMTFSKAFFIILILIFAFFALYFIIKFKWKSLKLIIPSLCLVGILCLIFRGRLITLWDRFFSYKFSDNLIGILTTGRSDIWEKYTDNLTSSPWKFLFGNGIFATEIVPITPHNLYLEVLFRVGLVGSICIGVLLYLYALCNENRLRFSWLRVLPLFIFLVHSIQETNFDERFLFLILAVMMLFDTSFEDINKNRKLNKNIKRLKGKNSKK